MMDLVLAIITCVKNHWINQKAEDRAALAICEIKEVKLTGE